jgi:hypothetical protein
VQEDAPVIRGHLIQHILFHQSLLLLKLQGADNTRQNCDK